MAASTRRSYRRQVVQFVVVFAILAGASSALETWMRSRHVGVGYQAAITRIVCTLVVPLGVDLQREHMKNECTIWINNVQMVVTVECAAVLATGLFLSAVLAFPGNWPSKLVGVMVGVVGVGLLNLLRIVMLAAVAQYAPDWFGVSHDVLMQGFLLIMVTPLWLGWLAWVMKVSGGPRPGRSPGQAAPKD